MAGGTFTVGFLGPYYPDQWYANLTRFRLTAVQTDTDSLMRSLVSQILTEHLELYNVRYAALQQHHSAQNAQHDIT